MDKRTIIAVVLSVAILGAGMFLPNILFPPKPAPIAVATENTKQAATPSAAAPTAAQQSTVSSSKPAIQNSIDTGLVDPSKPADFWVAVPADESQSQLIVRDDGRLHVTIDPKGARLADVKLPEYKDGTGIVDMVFSGTESGVFTRFGGNKGQEMTEVFLLAPQKDPNVFEFFRDYRLNNVPNQTVRVTKRYTFFPKEFVFQLDIGFENSVNALVPSTKGNAYSIQLGPQVGPTSSKINNSQDFRRFVYLSGTKREVPGVGIGSSKQLTEHVNWVAIDGKYFSFFLIPGAYNYSIDLETQPANTQEPGNQIALTRGPIEASKNFDSYRFYVGPRLTKELEAYTKSDGKPAGFQGLQLEKISDDLNLLRWLEDILKWIMQLFYYVAHNWGVSIILMTILVKGALFPLSKKSAESAYKMQALTPKINALKEKYKDNPKKMNSEMAAIYQKEKINPLGGCLPLLLQFPFFIAMYNLFNSHFDLRGAMFIPGWIPDLSLPETVIPYSFVLPILGTHVTGLHILPFLYVASQIVTSKLTQVASPGTSNGQMKFMMYGLPIVFFFILYEVPSGLLVYWIFQNILQLIQQQLVNGMLKKKQSA